MARPRSLNLLVLNLAMDSGHPALGHSVVWVNELARRANHITVITMTRGEAEVAENVTVHSVGKELGRSEPRRLVEFYRLVRKTLAEQPVDACFSHMAPVFTALFAPVARRRGIPILMWHAHPAVTRTLRVAHSLADRAVTPTGASFSLPSDKLHTIGHGVDTGVFSPPATRPAEYDRTLLVVGRLSASKHLREILEAFALLGRDLRLALVGAALTERDVVYAEKLRRRAEELGIAERVAFEGAVPFSEIPRVYHRAGLYLNLSETALDKATLEAMASGCVPVSSNPSFAEVATAAGFESLVSSGEPQDVARSIAAVLDAPPAERERLRADLRGLVEREHSLTRLADRVLWHLTDLTAAEASTRRGRSERRMAPARSDR
jgi:glycosyltransferase involved in cell wall biosynthesis